MPDPRLDLITIGLFERRPLRRTGRWAAGGHGLVRQVHRRQPDQHRRRRGAAGAPRRADHAHQRRPLRAVFHPGRAEARGRRYPRRGRRSPSPDRPGHPRHPRPRQLPPAVLPPGLRRHGAPPRGHRPGLHRFGQRSADQRHAPVDAPGVRGPASRRPGWRARAAPRWCSTSTTGRVLWGLTAPRPGRGSVRCRSPGGHRTPAPGCRVVRPHLVGTEEEFRILGGEAGCAMEALRAVRREPSDALLVLQARVAGLRGLRRRDRGPLSKTASRGPASTSRCSTCWAPGTRSWLVFSAGGCARRRWRRLATTPTPAAPWWSRVSCARPNTRLGPSSAVSSSAARLIARCAAMRRSITSIGRRRGGLSRLRSWRWRSIIARRWKRSADEAGAPREKISAFKLLAVDAAVKVAEGRPGYGMLLDGKYGREALFRAVDHDFWIGSTGRGAGFAAA